MTVNSTSRSRADSHADCEAFIHRRVRTILRALIVLLYAALALAPAPAQTRKPRAAVKRKPTTNGVSLNAQPAKSLIVASEPNAVVWMDGVRRGVTDEAGKLELNSVARAAHVLRVRAKGFAESTTTVGVAQLARGRVSVPLSHNVSEAERAFQDAEEAHEKATTDEARRAAVELYRHAVSLRPSYPEAHVAFARALAELGQFDDALKEVENARYGPVNAEASAVEGRIHHSAGDDDAALASYRRAIREAHGFQPEAHTGIGIILQERGDYAGAAAEFQKAIAQLSDTEPVLYQLLGEAYEKQEKYKDAVAAYEKYLQLAPTGKLAPAIESIIEQLRKQAAEQGAPPPEE